jgi:hypothetical protein
MRLHVVIVGALLVAGASLARASECGEQIRLLDDRYGLALRDAGDLPGDPHEQSASSGSSGASSSSAGIDTVPNTGGLANPHNTPVEPLDAAQREHLREALLDARRADRAGDGTTCAARVGEARRLVQGSSGAPRAR